MKIVCKCILKNCNTRIIENENKRKLEIKPLCFRIRVSILADSNLFISLTQEDLNEGIFLCLPHLENKHNAKEIVLKYGIEYPVYPKFTTPKAIKAGNIAMTSKSFRTRFSVTEIICTSSPYVVELNALIAKLQNENSTLKESLSELEKVKTPSDNKETQLQKDQMIFNLAVAKHNKEVKENEAFLLGKRISDNPV